MEARQSKAGVCQPRPDGARRWADREALHALWQEISAFSAIETDAALLCLMKWIARRINADNVIWIGGVRIHSGTLAKKDPFLGWRLRLRRPLRPDPAAYRKQLAAYYDRDHYGKLTPTYYDRSHTAHDEAHVGMDSRATISTTGRFRVFRLRDGWFDFPAFRRTLHYRLYYLEPGIVDRIMIGFPVASGRESFFLIDRFQAPGGPRRRLFSQCEAELAGEAARGVPVLHRRLFLDSGLLAGDKPLSPTERIILHGLLTPCTEKELAATTGQQISTLHKYVRALYLRFGVTSRAALMNLWLKGVKEK